MSGLRIARRDFIAALAATGGKAQSPAVRFGIVGAGGRGTVLARTLLRVPGTEIRAVCDIDENNLTRLQAQVEKASGRRPEGYQHGEEDYRRLMAREDLDAVLIATPWHWHAPMAIEAMKCGKYTGVEVPIALSIEDMWRLVDTCEQTHVPCMMLENWSFRRDNLAVLNMIRAGLLGEIVHCHCAHSHDCLHWFFDPKTGDDRWPASYLLKFNRDQYPTHSLGPVLSWMDVDCGDAFASVTSTATEPRGIYDNFARRFPNHSNANRKYAQGDIVTSVIRTHRGRTIVVNYDMQLPRPYDNRWMVQGARGVYDEDRAVVHLAGRTPGEFQWEPFARYQEQYDHAWWKQNNGTADAVTHGGADYVELATFTESVRQRAPLPLDIYDSVAMSMLVPLSGESIAKSSAPVACPDFTRGKWRSRKASFAVEPVA